jgi:Cys-tRNA(Pro)/Cys-tRNA(Cys) deacylase
VKEVQKLTAYIRGGVAALAAKKEFPVYADEALEQFKLISLSADTRRLTSLARPSDYLKMTKAKIAALAHKKG